MKEREELTAQALNLAEAARGIAARWDRPSLASAVHGHSLLPTAPHRAMLTATPASRYLHARRGVPRLRLDCW